MNGNGIWAVVPAKDLPRAKRRLAPLLSLEERRGFAYAMLGDVLTVLSGVSGLAGVILVTRDAELAAMARSFDARIIPDLRHEGPTMAATLAAARLSREGAKGMLVIPGDVPLATSAEIAALLDLARAQPSVALVPALADMGSNAIALSPPDAIPLRFGPRSFFLHQEAALERGIAPHILRLEGLGLDIDRPDDLAAFAARPSATRSYAYLTERGAIERLRHTRHALQPQEQTRGVSARDGSKK